MTFDGQSPGKHKMSEAEERNPWDQLPEESDVQYVMFCDYRDLGQKRSIGQFCKNRGKTRVSYTHELSSKFNWVERAQKFDIHLADLRRASAENIHASQVEDFRKRNMDFSKNAHNTAGMMLIIANHKLGNAMRQIAAADSEEKKKQLEITLDRTLGPWVRSAAMIANAASNNEAQALGVDRMLSLMADEGFEEELAEDG
jgi:hypothetical protein